MASFCGCSVMLYDKDICGIEVKHGKVYLEYFCPTEEAIFTREDLVFFLEQLDLDKEILSGEQI